MKITNPLRRTSVCLAALVPLSLWAAGAQDASKTSEATRRSRNTSEAVSKDMQGVWRLQRLVIPDREQVPPQPEIGYLLVSGSYFSLEIHGDWFMQSARIIDLREPTKTEDVMSGAMQTGVYRYEIDASGTLKASSLIGTKYLSDSAWEFEAPGTEREYDVEVTGNVLRFRSFEGQELTFQRVSHGSQERDIYGRLRPTATTPDAAEESEYELDADGEIKRDIYGRPVRKKPGDGR
jgi:hypothetical protein